MLNWRKFAGLSLTAGIVFVAAAFAGSPAAAIAQDNNRGDMWTQPAGTPEETSGHSQEVHLPCGAVDLWGDKLSHTSGNWVLYHQPPPNPPGPGTVLATGTYGYSGESSMKIATIPLADLHKNTGSHFKVELDNDNSKWKTFWLDCKIGITTTPNPSTAQLGALLKDSATLTNGFTPTGTITFELRNPGDVVVDTETAAVNGNGAYTTPTGFVANAAGTWHWRASYGGNDGNDAVASNFADEPVTVGKADPTLTTTQDPAAGLVGVTLKDGATLSHGYNPTGQITFFLDDPNGHNVFHETVDVDGNGTYSTTHGYAANVSGTWQWRAEYTGDANNNARHTAVGDEPVIITTQPVTPAMTTTQLPATARVGDVLKDKATLTGTNNATGTITFELFDPNGHSAYHVTVTVNQNHTEYTTPDGFMAYGAGTWYWVATYSGDQNNKGLASGAHDEPVTVNKADPSITTSQIPVSGLVGTTLNDSATLTGYHPTGTITFFLDNPSGVNVYHETVNVTNGNGTYSTVHGFAADATGTWHWRAEYNGDANNNEVHSVAIDEPVVITTGEQPTAPTINTTPVPQSGLVGATLHDKATLAGGNNPTGTITFTLYSPAGVAVHTETVTVNGNGTYSTITGHAATLPVVTDAIGVWHWKAAYSGDQTNAPVASNAADEPVTIAGGEVLAATGLTTPLQTMALGLIGIGLMALMGALAVRRRQA